MRRGRTLRNRAPRRDAAARRPRARLRLALVVVYLVSTAGCAWGRVRPTVKLGLVAPFEGRHRYVGYDVIYGVRLALGEVNKLRGVEGHSVELLAFDDAGDASLAVQQARKLLTDTALVGVIGHFREGTTAAASAVYSATGIPLVAISIGASDESRSLPIFRVGAPAESVAAALLELVLEDPNEHEVVLVTAGGPLGRAVVRQAQEVGFPVAAVVSPDDEGGLALLSSLGEVAVLCDLDPVPAGEVLVALRRASWKGIMLGGPELLTADFRAVAGDYADGVWSVTPWPFPDDLHGTERFVEAYKTVSGGAAPGPLGLAAYEATWVVLEAMEKDVAANLLPTTTGLATALGETDRGGLLGRIRFDDNGNWRDGPVYTYRVDGGGVPTLVEQE